MKRRGFLRGVFLAVALRPFIDLPAPEIEADFGHYVGADLWGWEPRWLFELDQPVRVEWTRKLIKSDAQRADASIMDLGITWRELS